MTKRPAEEITDHEDPETVTRTIAYHALPYPFGDQSAQSLYMWCVEQVLQHAETPLTDTTRKFIKGIYTDVVAAGTVSSEPNITVVK
jgi:hypothetical protein